MQAVDVAGRTLNGSVHVKGLQPGSELALDPLGFDGGQLLGVVERSPLRVHEVDVEAVGSVGEVNFVTGGILDDLPSADFHNRPQPKGRVNDCAGAQVGLVVPEELPELLGHFDVHDGDALGIRVRGNPAVTLGKGSGLLIHRTDDFCTAFRGVNLVVGVAGSVGGQQLQNGEVGSQAVVVAPHGFGQAGSSPASRCTETRPVVRVDSPHQLTVGLDHVLAHQVGHPLNPIQVIEGNAYGGELVNGQGELLVLSLAVGQGSGPGVGLGNDRTFDVGPGSLVAAGRNHRGTVSGEHNVRKLEHFRSLELLGEPLRQESVKCHIMTSTRFAGFYGLGAPFLRVSPSPGIGQRWAIVKLIPQTLDQPFLVA